MYTTTIVCWCQGSNNVSILYVLKLQSGIDIRVKICAWHWLLLTLKTTSIKLQKFYWSFIDVVFNVNKSQCQAQILTLLFCTCTHIFCLTACMSNGKPLVTFACNLVRPRIFSYFGGIDSLTSHSVCPVIIDMLCSYKFN